jgi:carotenoid cleavage dioxygenase
MNPYQNLYLSNLQKTHPHIIAGAIQRFIINLDAKHCSSDALTEMKHEFPNIHPQLNGEYYQYLYCNSLEGQECKFLNSIQKINMATGKIQIWKKDQYYPGEPVFVASNNPASEDDGVLLSIIYNNANQCSLLAIIDAKTMQEIAEVHLNFYLPLGLHGNFYQ